MIDAYTILLIRSAGVAIFAVIAFVSTGLLIWSRLNGITGLFAVCTGLMTLQAVFIFYSGLSNTLARDLPQGTLDFNYWNWTREAAGWWSLSVAHTVLGVVLMREKRKDARSAD